jgi:hypothetical protein
MSDKIVILYNKTDKPVTFIRTLWYYLDDHISSAVFFISVLEHGAYSHVVSVFNVVLLDKFAGAAFWHY